MQHMSISAAKGICRTYKTANSYKNSYISTLWDDSEKTIKNENVGLVGTKSQNHMRAYIYLILTPTFLHSYKIGITYYFCFIILVGIGLKFVGVVGVDHWDKKKEAFGLQNLSA